MEGVHRLSSELSCACASSPSASDSYPPHTSVYQYSLVSSSVVESRLADIPGTGPAPARLSRSCCKLLEEYLLLRSLEGYRNTFGESSSSESSKTTTLEGGLWSSRIAPRLLSRDASPVRTRSDKTMESSAFIGCTGSFSFEEVDDIEVER